MLRNNDPSIANALAQHWHNDVVLTVSLSNELIRLLSEQLYQSPLKAIEELVVNAYDANASECRIYIPQLDAKNLPYVAVFDDGSGMSREGLHALWYVGHSNKRDLEAAAPHDRKQIGKFGIGKLATYAIADNISYITKTDDGVLGVTVDFREFSEQAQGPSKGIPIQSKLLDREDLRLNKRFVSVCSELGVDVDKLFTDEIRSWTFCVLESLKPKARSISPGRLRWVLSTAMPLTTDFRLYLNRDEVVSSKESLD